ncbi:ATP-binding response regulator [Sulfurimonas sp.]|uniref:ATP-binding response regulator n=1 Tax=Sulfurimonas sp. TaxID=2022749 RepID=UPI003D13E52C
MQNFTTPTFQNGSDISNQAIKNEIATFIHDIRTPASTLHGFLELLEDHIQDNRFQEYIFHAKESTIFINKLISSMLERVSLSKEKEISQNKEIESARFFAGIAEMFIPNMYDKHIDFNIYIDPLLPKIIELDELKLKRIILNLIGNAYKFTPAEKTIEFQVTYNRRKEEVTIAVNDTGIGIAKEKQEKIFQAYQQADDTTSIEYGGTGLGLSICSEYIDDLGGKLELFSEVGKGSKFFFTLPLQTKTQESHLTPCANSDIKIAVLMSEKNGFSFSNLSRYFQKMGFEKNNIMTVSSFEEIPDDVTHLIVYQHKFNSVIKAVMAKFSKILIVEEKLYTFNNDDLLENCGVISQYGYYAQELYKFITVDKAPKILIADDDKVSVSLLKRIFRDEYCEVDIAYDGQKALDMIINAYNEQNPYNVIYIDNHMPFLNGNEVIRQVRNFERINKFAPVYAVAITGDLFDLKKYKDVDKHIGKPFRVADIRGVFHERTK